MHKGYVQKLRIGDRKITLSGTLTRTETRRIFTERIALYRKGKRIWYKIWYKALE